MKNILVFVSSLDGKVTKWGKANVRLWSSHQDQEYYKNILTQSEVIIMGSNTYHTDTFNPSAKQLYLIMTSHPENYHASAIPGQLEFTNDTPQALTERFKALGYKQMTIIGGAHIATSFFREQLIDELWLTIEPKIFGTGGSFVTNENLDISLRLLNIENMNEQGTLLTKYAVMKKK